MTILAVNWGNALLITGVGFGLVFSVLVLLIFIVKLFGVIFVQKPKAQPAVAAAAAPAESSDETDMAAIAYVLHTFYNQHDEESDVLTIRHDDVAYSPWNQKSITF
ncbi:MAG: OadG family protein [Alistipes sp.]|nr:OadG family protein [Alistipes sp.]